MVDIIWILLYISFLMKCILHVPWIMFNVIYNMTNIISYESSDWDKGYNYHEMAHIISDRCNDSDSDM